MARSRNPNLPKNTVKEIEEVVQPIPELAVPEPAAPEPQPIASATSNAVVPDEARPKVKKTAVKKDKSVRAPLFPILKDERFVKIVGLSALLGGAFLLAAFSSFYFSWKYDMDKVLEPGQWIQSPLAEVHNAMGKLGALVAHLFLFKWFGFASFAIGLVLLNLGLKVVFNLELLPVRGFAGYSFFALIWLPILLNIALPAYPLWGGGFGYFVNIWLLGLIGKIGIYGLLGFTFLVLLVVNINLKFYRFEKKAVTATAASPTAVQVAEKQTSTATAPVSAPTPVEAKEATSIDFEHEAPVNLPQNLPFNPTPVELELDVVEKKEDEMTLTVASGVKNITEEDSEGGDLPFGEYDPTLELSSYKHPHLDLLDNHPVSKEATVNAAELNANKDKIVSTLNNYGISIDKIKATIGPTVTLYEIVPSAGVRISKIKNLEDDIALSLSALGIRIIAPIPGKGTIGIEVPNSSKELVGMRSLLASDKFQNSKMDLPIALGKTIENETFIADLAKMPHLLMAGATGQGKSVGLNAILVSLLYKKHPSQIKFVLVDPKKVELTLFNKIERHFLAKLPGSEEAIITDTKKVIHTLNSLCIEMDQRYNLLKNAQVRNLREYNAKFIARKLNPNNGGHKFLPYIVLVIDEFADLIMTAGKEVEMPIARLAQLARAVGIHLIIATQRPSVNIITGTIKANFPARIAFRVTSKIDSRTILDSGGADQLIGYGDMLLSTGNDLIRIQCAFVDTPEVENITEFIGSQRGYPEAFELPEYIDEMGEGGGMKDADNVADRDSMFAEAARLVVSTQQGSASLLQRRLNLGYARAGRIIDQLEAARIVGAHNGSKFRDVLIKDAVSLEQFLNSGSAKSGSPLDDF